jgi:DNA mismatch repair ATPase MutS
MRGGGMDDRTWADLNGDALFEFFDRTHSAVGRQVLYHRLRTPETDVGELQRFDALISSVEPRRKELAKALGRLDDDRAYLLPHLFLQPLPEPTRFGWLYPLLSLTAVVATVACFITSAALIPALLLLAINIGVEMFYRRRIFSYIQPLRTLNAFITAGEAIGVAGVERLGRLRRATAWLIVESEARDDLISIAVQYINMFLLADVNAFAATLGIVERERDTIARLHESIGTVDAALAIGAARADLPVYATPDFTNDGTQLVATSAYHPLLRDAVANSISINANGVLVTGSNMSGKSTFLRTIGVNALLAQTIYTTCAREWRSPLVAVKSSIGRGDDLLEGKSYYLAEVERVGELLRDAASAVQHLFIIDEIFRGTNAIERVAAARAVLARLVSGDDFVIAATHDLELVSLLAESYDAYHFRELIESGALSFDYKLQRGPSSTRNAIAILELLGFPPGVVADAERTVAELEQRRY